jgi:hypothetical protein
MASDTEIVLGVGQGLPQLGELGLALLLSAAIGMERELGCYRVRGTGSIADLTAELSELSGMASVSAGNEFASE